MKINWIEKNIIYLFTLLVVYLWAVSCQNPDNLYSVKEFPDEPAQIISTGFSKGVNLVGSFQVEEDEDAKDIRPALISDKVFGELKSLGCDVVRVPMNFDRFVGDAPDYSFQPEFWIQLDRLLDLGEEYDITIIIVNNSWNLTEKFPSDQAQGFMEKTWRQIAKFCEERLGNIVYELKSCPDGDYWKQNWATVQENLIKMIRTIDQKHSIIICPAEGNSIASLPEYEESNIIYSIPFYKPFIFTHQGLKEYGLGETGGTVTFPYDPSQPLHEPDGISADYKTMYASYNEEGTISNIERELTQEINIVKERKAKMFVGEFGCAAFTGIPDSERAKWYEVVRKRLDMNNVAWTVSSYTKDFSIFRTDEESPDFYRDLNIPVVQALGFDVPPGYDGMEDVRLIFGDQWEDGITTHYGPGTEGIIEVRKEDAYRGNKAVYWKIGTDNNCFIDIEIPELLDLSAGVDDYIIQFALKHSVKADKLKVFLWDKHASGASYRMECNLSKLPETEDYQIMQIPLSSFNKGWGILPDGNWVDPGMNQFDWSRVYKITFTVEGYNYRGDLIGGEFRIDEIAIRKPQ